MSITGFSQGTQKERSKYTVSAVAPLSEMKASPDLFLTSISYLRMDQLPGA